MSNKEEYGIEGKTGKAGNTVSMKQVSSILMDMDKPDELSYYVHPRLNMALLRENRYKGGEY